MKEELLEFIARQRDCFISSLPDLTGDPAFLADLIGLLDGRFSLEEWNYALGYLFRGEVAFLEISGVEGFLLREREKLSGPVG